MLQHQPGGAVLQWHAARQRSAVLKVVVDRHGKKLGVIRDRDVVVLSQVVHGAVTCAHSDVVPAGRQNVVDVYVGESDGVVVESARVGRCARGRSHSSPSSPRQRVIVSAVYVHVPTVYVVAAPIVEETLLQLRAVDLDFVVPLEAQPCLLVVQVEHQQRLKGEVLLAALGLGRGNVGRVEVVDRHLLAVLTVHRDEGGYLHCGVWPRRPHGPDPLRHVQQEPVVGVVCDEEVLAAGRHPLVTAAGGHVWGAPASGHVANAGVDGHRGVADGDEPWDHPLEHSEQGSGDGPVVVPLGQRSPVKHKVEYAAASAVAAAALTVGVCCNVCGMRGGRGVIRFVKMLRRARVSAVVDFIVYAGSGLIHRQQLSNRGLLILLGVRR